MDKKRAIIVGATSGIGLEIAKVLSEQGWSIGIAGRRMELLKEIQKNVPNTIAIRRIDVNQTEATAELEALINEMGGMELYFHSSGIGFQNPSLDMEKEVNTTITNVVGVTRMLNVAFKYFQAHPKKPGHIAVISSIAGTKGLGAAPAYSASKRYVNHYLECLTQLCTIKGITHIHIHDIRPGFVRTALLGDGNPYPMQLEARPVAQEIVRGIQKNHSIITVDWKYRVLVFFWRLIPRWLWVRMKIRTDRTTDCRCG